MRKIVLLLIFLIPIVLYGKKTKKITLEYFYPSFKEIFYVLKSDTTVRNGSYRIVANGKTLVLGYYKTGLKDSLWTQYNQKSILRFRGYYKEDKRVGLWEFYDDKGEPEQKIDFSNNQLILYRSQLSRQVFRIISGSDSVFSLLDRPPLYLGGSSIIKEYIANEIRPPLHKTKEKAEGTVFIEFTVDSTGMTSNHHILKGIGTRCNLEALRVVKALPDKWIPGILNGRTVSVNYIIPVIFDKNTYWNHPSDILIEE